MRHLWRRYGELQSSQVTTAETKNDGATTIYQDVQEAIRNQVPIAKRRWRGQTDVSYLRPLIEKAKRDAENTEQSNALSGAKAWAWLYALVLQAPQSALAQVQMDHHPHGYHNKGMRLYELIDFNDAFVATVLALTPDELTRFGNEVRVLVDWFCKRVGVRTFTDEQFRAIVVGLEREIAVYRGLQAEGFQAYMTSRAKDALGIDIVANDPRTGKTVNLDIKAPSAFRHRIYKLLQERRLSGEEVTAAEALGYIAEMNGHGHERTEIVVWRIEEEKYGVIKDFGFSDTTQLGATMREILVTYGTVSATSQA